MLISSEKSFASSTGIVTGWGVKKTGGSTSPTLQEVEVPIMTNDDCKKSAYGKTRITENMLCAGYAEGEKDSCQVKIVYCNGGELSATSLLKFTLISLNGSLHLGLQNIHSNI